MMGANGAVAKAEEYANGIIERLDELIQRADYERAKEQMLIVRAFGTADAATFVLEDQVLTAGGTSWLIERMTVNASPAANSQVEIYLDEIQPQNLITQLAVNAATGMATQAPSNGFYIPGGGRLIIRFVNQVIGTVVAVNFQVRQRTAVDVGG